MPLCSESVQDTSSLLSAGMPAERERCMEVYSITSEQFHETLQPSPSWQYPGPGPIHMYVKCTHTHTSMNVPHTQ